MNKIIEKELYFKDIDCAACAAKIETLLNKDSNIIEANLNFISKKIIISYCEDVEIVSLVQSIARKIEVDAVISETPFLEEDCHHHEHNNECECDHHHEHNNECECDHHHEHNNECECDHHHEHNKENIRSNHHKSIVLKQIFLFSGVLIALTATILKIIDFNEIVNILVRVMYIFAYLLLAYQIIIKSIKNIKKGNIFDENLLMVIASVGALVINENLEAILVVLLYRIGEYFQDKALGESTDAIGSLTKLKVEYATLISGKKVLTEKLVVGDIIVIKVGERVPVDGIVVNGNSSLDIKILTGESIPKDVTEGDEVLSGCINLQKVIEVRVTKIASESTANKIIKMVELAGNKKSKTEEFITKFAAKYTPCVLIAAIIVFLVEWLLIDQFTISDALNNVFVFLVTSCPCALIISIPLAFYGGIGKCSSFGILVKGGNYLEALSKTKTICFDKTGTLTKGNFKVVKIDAVNGEKQKLIDYIVAVEKYSNHPIAVAICQLEATNQQLVAQDVEEISGYGLSGIINNEFVIIGNDKLMIQNGIEVSKNENYGTIIYCAVNHQYLGSVIIVDEIKEEAYELIHNLKNLKIKTAILTGDKKSVADNVAKKLGIDDVKAELLPADKLLCLEQIINNKVKNSSVVYVGDGINDTPAIKLADVGIAIGGFGNDEAVNTSDIVLMSNNMNNLVNAIKIAKYTKKILVENIVFSLVVKFLALIIGIIGILGSYGMLLGVFADVGVCLLTILNTFRILKMRKF